MWKIGVLALVAFAAAQAPERCDSPPQWHGDINMFDPSEGHEFAVEGQYYYDKTNLRKARIERVDETRNTSHRYVHVIELFGEHKRFDIDLQTRECVATPLNRPGPLDGFHPHDVPIGAQFRGLFDLGSDVVEQSHLECSSWDYEFKDRGYFWHGTFTTHGCIPLRSDSFNSTEFGARFEEFYNIVAGLPDPSVFVPPKECTQSKF